MKARTVTFTPEARADVVALYDWIAEAASPGRALSYIERIEAFCAGLGQAAERGHLRDDIRPGLRIIGFERRATIAFMVEADRVVILRLFYGGRDWETILE